MKKLIYAYVREADKDKKTAERHVYECNCEGECEVLARGQCVHYRIFGSGCPYGEYDVYRTCTPRAKAYRSQLQALQQLPKGQYIESPSTCLAKVGDYVYVPYAHADMCQDVPFYRHSHLFLSGIPFIKLADFTPEVVVKLANFRPGSLMGGEIRDYQEKSVPLFLMHLKLQMRDLFDQACALDPLIAEKLPNFEKFIGTETTLDKIPAGVVDGYTVGKNLIPKHWDGEIMTLVGKVADLVGCFAPVSGGEAELKFAANAKSVKIVLTSAELIARIAAEHPEVIRK
jgi:hypothetical protein